MSVHTLEVQQGYHWEVRSKEFWTLLLFYFVMSPHMFPQKASTLTKSSTNLQRKLLLLVLWFINMWYLWPLADLKYLPQTRHTRQTFSLSTAWRCWTKSISQSNLSLQCLQKKELAILAEIGMPIGTTGASWVTTTKEPWKPTNRKTSVNTQHYI